MAAAVSVADRLAQLNLDDLQKITDRGVKAVVQLNNPRCVEALKPQFEQELSILFEKVELLCSSSLAFLVQAIAEAKSREEDFFSCVRFGLY